MVATIKTVKTLQNNGLVVETPKGWANIVPAAGGWKIYVGGVWEGEYDAPHSMATLDSLEVAIKVVDNYLN